MKVNVLFLNYTKYFIDYRLGLFIR